MKIKILRSSGQYSEYNVPFTNEDGRTLMDVLEYIFYNLDATLSYYSHSTCNHGICGRCGIKINGKVRLACAALAEGDELVLEPKNSQVVKDLVTA